MEVTLMEYPFPTISVNGRDVSLADIRADKARAKTLFEGRSFEFIRDWLRGTEQFTLHTSGSTGHPKAIRVTRQQMQHSARATVTALGITKGMHALVCLDTRFVAGKMMLVRCFVAQLRIILVEPSSNPLVLVPDDTRIDFAALVPLQLTHIIRTTSQRLEMVKTIIVGGAAVSGEILPELEKHQTRIYSTYGMTETVSHIALCRLNGPQRSDWFQTLPGVKVNRDDRGCLTVKVPFLPSDVHTNDLVEIQSETTFRWIGRIDNVINTGGIKVSPESVESVLEKQKNRLNLHERFIVTSLPDQLLGERLICVLEVGQLDMGRKAWLLDQFEEILQKYEVPKAIFTLIPFPETATGKVDRRTLRELIQNTDD